MKYTLVALLAAGLCLTFTGCHHHHHHDRGHDRRGAVVPPPPPKHSHSVKHAQPTPPPVHKPQQHPLPPPHR